MSKNSPDHHDPGRESNKDDYELLYQRFESFEQDALPNPEVLEKYNQIIPDAGERWMSLWEKEQEHRHATQSKEVDNGIKMEKR